MFEFLFKYRYLLFERGDIALRPPWSGTITLLIGAAIIGFAWFSYRRSAVPVPTAWRVSLAVIRAAALLLCLLILQRPVLVLRSVVPQKNFLAVAYDTSKSMGIRDASGGRSRMDLAGELLGNGQKGIVDQLAAKFRLRFFRFSMGAERTGTFEQAARGGNRTDLERTLDQISGELAGVPLSGIVLVTDGADNSSGDLTAAASRLAARKIPVYAVGVGASEIARDVEVVRASAPRKVLKDSMMETDVAVRSVGYAGQRARLVAREGNRIVQSLDIQLGADDEVRTHKLNFSSDAPGSHLFNFRVEPLGGETVPENNDMDVLVRVQDSQPEVLYVEGEPRWIFGFLRRSAEEDKNIRLVTLLRQADGKFLRQGIESPETLEKGFPAEKADLFKYRAIVLGSVEATFFTFDQLRLISDFVGQRGGGLLALGGRNSFAEGGYINTPLEDVLPMALRGSPAGAAGYQDVEFKFQPTDYGLENPVTRLAVDEASSRKRWDSAPALVGLNPIAGPKPGATVLARGRVGQDSRPGPAVLLFQRFGRGRAMALTTASTWRWKMEMDHRDNLHDQFWKQMLRWLVSDAPDNVEVTTTKHSYSADEPVSIRAEVRDSSFMLLNDARTVARVKAPSGETTTVPLVWDVTKDGLYGGEFTPREEGIHEIELEATRAGRSLGSGKAAFRIAESNDEYHGAALNESLLKRLSAETRGRYYRASDVRTLPEDISYVDTGAARLEEKDLWDMPFLFLLLAALLGTEWALRKKKGLA